MVVARNPFEAGQFDIAALRYGDPGQWRVLADVNRIVDPLDLEPGSALAVPDLEASTRA